MSRQTENINSIRINELDKRMNLQLQSQEKTTELASNELKARLHAMNEFREQLKEQNSTFITRESYELNMRVIEAKIETLQKMVYIGIGIVLVLEVLLKVFIK